MAERARGIVTEDPLSSVPVGGKIGFQPFFFPLTDAATKTPQSVNNWDIFEGTILAVSGRSSEGTTVFGTAVVIAPGLAVTAAHLFNEAERELMAKGELVPFCTGITGSGLDFWLIRSFTSAPDSDVAFVTIEMRSELAPARRLRKAVITTRQPFVGEVLTLVGFRIEAANSAEFHGHVYVAAGEVEEVFPHGVAASRPTPVVQVDCGTLGRMSGGAAFDSEGFLIGIISSGIDPANGPPASFVALLVAALNREVSISWPPNLYEQPIHLLHIHEQALHIEGRDKIAIVDANTYVYTPWSRR